MSSAQDELEYESIVGTDFITPDQMNDNFAAMYAWYTALYKNIVYPKQTVNFGAFDTAGYITSSKTEVRFCIPLGHVVVASGISSITGEFKIRQKGNYLVGDADFYESMPATGSLSGGKNYINVVLTSNHKNHDNITGQAGTEQNNAPCGIATSGLSITFS